MTPDIIKQTARKLRQDMTPSEKILWEEIRAEKIGIKFYRQKPIFVFKEDSGLERYIIADFYAPQLKLVIELDGSVHNEKVVYALDRIKDQLLKKRGFQIIRFTNNEIINDIQTVLLKIKCTLSPCSLPKE